MPFSCHRFARVVTLSGLNLSSVCILSHGKELCPSHVALSTDAFNTVLNIQERKNVPTGQNKHHKFLKMPQMWHNIMNNLWKAEAPDGFVVFCHMMAPESLLRLVRCHCSSRVQFGGRKHLNGLTRAHRSRTLIPVGETNVVFLKSIFIKNNSCPRIAECLALLW